MNTRIALIGPTGADDTALRTALDRLLPDPGLRQILYLGKDGAAKRVVAQRLQGSLDEANFLVRAADLAQRGSADEIDDLLGEDLAVRRLSLVRKLPDPPARAVEMLDRWIVLAVHDKAVLDEDDIANAHVIVYGKASEASLDRFGPRCFFTPGPISGGRVGVIELSDDGGLDVRVTDLAGNIELCEQFQVGAAKLVVTT